MNISTTYPFNGKHLSGKIYDKWIQKTYPGLAFVDINTNGFDKTPLEKLAVINVSTLTEIRDEINDLITFMVSLEPGKEKASDAPFVEKAKKEPSNIHICICGMCHKNESEGILYHSTNKEDYVNACYQCSIPYLYKYSPYKFEPFTKKDEKHE